MRMILAALALFASVAVGAPVSPFGGGTGKANPNTSIVTVAGPLTTVGNFLTTLTITAPTAITLPTSGTLATTAQIAGGTLAGSFTTLSASTSITMGSGVTGVSIQPYTGGTSFALYNASVIPGAANYALAGSATSTLLNGVTNSLIQVNNATVISATTTGAAVTGILSATSFNDDAGNLIISSTNPTIASGFGTGPACSPCNNTAAFKVTVGTGGLDSTGVITMPPAAAGWACHVLNLTDTSTAHMLRMTSMSTTSLTVTNSVIGGGNQPFGVANVLLFQCAGF